MSSLDADVHLQLRERLRGLSVISYLEVLPTPAYVTECGGDARVIWRNPIYEMEIGTGEIGTGDTLPVAMDEREAGDGYVWTHVPVEGRFIVSTSVRTPSSSASTSSISMSELVVSTAPTAPTTPAAVDDDWTRLWDNQCAGRSDAGKLQSAYRKHVQCLREANWKHVGATHMWPQNMRMMTSLVLACPFPCALYWGPQHSIFYNAAYIPLTGDRHPDMLGKSYNEGWPELWEFVKDTFGRAFQGEAVHKDDDMLFMNRLGFVEETYFSWSIVPIRDENGEVCGLLNPAFEGTRRVIAARRLHTLRELGSKIASVKSVEEFWEAVKAGVDDNKRDIPILVTYSIKATPGEQTKHAKFEFTRECVVGLPEDHGCIPPKLTLETKEDVEYSDITFERQIFEAFLTHESVVVDDLRQLTGDIPSRGWGDPVRKVIVSPVIASEYDIPLAVTVLALNPRRPYNEDYRTFIELLGRSFVTGLASVRLVEEELRHAKQEIERREEVEQLLVRRTKELRLSEGRFGRMAEGSPAGIFIADAMGHVTFVNEAWYEFSQFPKDQNPDHWLDSVHAEDKHRLQEFWDQLLSGGKAEVEFRWVVEKNGYERWCVSAGTPELDDEGHVLNVLGVCLDISERKRHEALQKKIAEEALESKRQQEYFIDMTSHELRNPLSAIIQLCDLVADMLHRLQKGATLRHAPAEIHQDIVESDEAIKTITLCTSHMKRIIDDTLTLSKLDSSLLLVTPVDCQPLKKVKSVLKMFEAEVQSKDIDMKFEVDESWERIGVDWVKADPSRFSQVLINLLTNAIKFSYMRPVRKITVRIAASLTRPAARPLTECDHDHTHGQQGEEPYSMTRQNSQESVVSVGNTSNADAVSLYPETENTIYLSFSVVDTGRGLSPSERAMLFQRFSQATPRTHVEYGGSGLGLFICRKLTGLQGGEISVQSKENEGSTFSFYIHAERGSAPEEGEGAAPAEQRRRSVAEVLDGVPKPELGAPKTARSPTAAEEVAKTVREAKLDKLSILVVEDNLINQKVLQKQLTAAGCETRVANNGQEALDIIFSSALAASTPAEAPKIDVVLMDVEMPVMDGLTAARHLRVALEEGKLRSRVPLIAVSANARREQIAAMLEAGMDDTVGKPFRIPELMAKIRDLLEKLTLHP
ncbi:hypothetical protein YB2330_002684 [Saitoella coloradoensis]